MPLEDAFDRQKRGAQKSVKKGAAKDRAEAAYRKGVNKFGRPEEDPSSRRAAKTQTHTVVSGDTLSGIAKKYYGASDNWNAIYMANKEIIGDDPNRIRVGQELTIPDID